MTTSIDKIGSGPFSAKVVYAQPTVKELRRRFLSDDNPESGGSRLDPDGVGWWFDPIDRCRSISKESRAVAFEYVHLGRDATTNEVLSEMDRKGLRPALYEELLGFAENYPNEQLKHPIVALGSVGNICLRTDFAYLWGRSLLLHWRNSDWRDDGRFLAVRK